MRLLHSPTVNLAQLSKPLRKRIFTDCLPRPFVTAASIFNRLRIMPASFIKRNLRPRCKMCDLGWIEPNKGFPVSFATQQNRPPCQARLSSFEQEHLEVFAVIMYRHAPFLIMVANEMWLQPDPTAPILFG